MSTTTTITTPMNTEQRNGRDVEPWYRQFWPWMLIGLPAIAVIASFTSLFIAIDKADDTVADNYYKNGLAINQELAADQQAKTLGLRAQLGLDPQPQQLIVTLQGQLAPAPAQLRAQFAHPVSADDDFTVILTAIAPGQYRGRLLQKPHGRWTVDITDPASAAWRLREEIAIPADISARTTFDFVP